jgi:hypothetical protein
LNQLADKMVVDRLTQEAEMQRPSSVEARV